MERENRAKVHHPRISQPGRVNGSNGYFLRQSLSTSQTLGEFLEWNFWKGEEMIFVMECRFSVSKVAFVILALS